MNPTYVLYCEQCQRKVPQHIQQHDDYVNLVCENMHTTAYAIVDLVLCYTNHCEDTDEPKVLEATDSH